MILIYSDSQICDLEWIPHICWPDQIEICRNIQKYVESDCPIKIAFTMHRLFVQHDADVDFYVKIKRLSAASDLVFAFESELHNAHWDIWAACHCDNVYWLVPGQVNDRPDINSHIIFWGDWFKTTANLYKQLPDRLQELRPHDIKPRYFDALLGVIKPHRTFVHDSVKGHGLQDHIIMTYGGSWDDNNFYARDYFIWEPGCEPLQDIIGTADWVRYHGIQAHLSQVIPIQVYNDSAYSVVAETDHDNTLSFFSEKTAKVLVARRLFIAFSGYRFLSNLRSLGFRTFDDIIDESYDDVKNDDDRYTAAFEQVRKLCAMDQREVLESIRPVVDHNHSLIMQRDWTRYSVDKIQALIRSFLSTVD